MPKNIVILSDGTGQDGGVRPEQRWSNIYKMFRVCRVGPETAINPREQVVFYDPGLGTDTTATGWTSIKRRVQKLLASVDGRGIVTNIADCYEFIINHYEPGDRIFLFGFSRGAYTARSVANCLMLCGVPTTGPDGMPLRRFRRATRLIADEAVTQVLEHGAGHERGKYEDERFELGRRFRERYGSEHDSGEPDRSNVAPYFVGVFDTVAALGSTGVRRLVIKAGFTLSSASVGLAAGALVALPAAGWLAKWTGYSESAVFWSLVGAAALIAAGASFYRQRVSIKKTIHDFPNKGDVSSHYAEWKGENFDRLMSKFVNYGRSANAIDETRADFDRVPWGHPPAAELRRDGIDRLKQPWFAGNHSDVGGSYLETESRLSDIPLLWMIKEAISVPHPLVIGPVYENGALVPGTGTAGAALHVFPDAGGLQHCEVAGMQDTLDATFWPWLRKALPLKGWEVKIRTINPKAVVDPSVHERFKLAQVPQCVGDDEYRPPALREHEAFKHLYPRETKAA